MWSHPHRRRLINYLMGIGLLGIFLVSRMPREAGSRWQTVSALTFSPDGQTLAAGMYNGLLRQSSGRWLPSDLCRTVALIDPGGKSAPDVLEQRLRVGDWHSLISVASGTFLDFSPDSGFLASGGLDGVVTLWDLQARRVQLHAYSGLNHIGYVAFSRDGRRLAAAGRHWGVLWDPRELGRGRDFETWVNVRALAVSPDGQWVAVGGHRSPMIEVWNADTLSRAQLLSDVPDETVAVCSLAFSPDGEILAAANSRSLQLWNVRDWELQAEVHERMVLDVDFSPDQRLLATASANGVKLWDPQTGSALGRFQTGRVESLAFAPDGSRLATADSRGRVAIRDAITGKMLRSAFVPARWRTYVPVWLTPALCVLWIAAWLGLRRLTRPAAAGRFVPQSLPADRLVSSLRT